MRGLLLGCVLVLAGVPAPSQTIKRAYIGQDGLVHVAYKGREDYVAPKEIRLNWQRLGNSDDVQASVGQLTVSVDRRTAAWLVNFPNCCTSYPIPLTLVVFRHGRVLQRFIGERPIFRFVFERGGRAIAYYEDMLHGDSAAHCTLRDVSTGRLLSERRIGDKGPLPSWALPFRRELSGR